MSDIVERLRASVTQCRALDRAALLSEAADEIERLRSYEKSDAKRRDFGTGGATLTDAEREAVCYVAGSLDHLPWYQQTLRGLLERTN